MSTPLVCLHGFMDTARTWELVRPTLERHHDVLAPTLPGHLGGPPLGAVSEIAFAEAVEAAMDEAGFATAHLVGNSLGGYLALVLATRGRARSVVALAPAGGWAEGDDSYEETLALQEQIAATTTPYAAAIAATAAGRRRATEYLTTNFEHLPADLVAHLILGVASCTGSGPMIEYARREGWRLDTAKVRCPLRILWGTEDRLLPWPRAAERYRRSLDAEWIELDGVGHSPQLDVPLETAQLIAGFTAM